MAKSSKGIWGLDNKDDEYAMDDILDYWEQREKEVKEWRENEWEHEQHI